MNIMRFRVYRIEATHTLFRDEPLKTVARIGLIADNDEGSTMDLVVTPAQAECFKMGQLFDLDPVDG